VKGRLAGAGPSAAADAFAAAGGREEPLEHVEVQVELIEADGVRQAARKAVRRGGAVPTPEAAGSRRRKPPPKALVEELEPIAGSGAPKIAARLADAGRAFEAERFGEAQKILGPLARRAPDSAAVRELHGLTLYRLGRWAAAAKELEAFRELTGSTEQHPVLADSYRALRRYDEVESLWNELREASPSAELVAEGRIVFAGSLADRGELARAIATVEPSVRRIKSPRHPHQLRLLYVLGDLYERAGDVPRARQLFDRVLAADPDFGDARSRRRQL
jgi:tetratricopeptide (TPR) repeat protein